MSQKPEIVDEAEGADEVEQPGAPKLSKNQKKKLKQQAKKEQEKLKADTQPQKTEADQPVEETKEEEKKDPKKKKDSKKPSAAAMMALKAAEKRRQQEQEYEKKKKQFEEEQKRLEEIEKEKQRIKAEQKALKKAQKLKQKEQARKLGLYHGKKNAKKLERDRQTRQQNQKFKNQDDSDDESSQQQTQGEKTAVEPATTLNESQVKNENQNAQQPQAVEKQAPKKKFVKKKEKTLQQIYKQALQKKAEAQKQKESLGVQNWEDLVQGGKNTGQNIKKESVDIKNVDKVDQTKKPQIAQNQKPKQEKKKKQKKKKEKQVEPEPQKKKEERQLDILIDKKKFFNVDDNEVYRSPICCILGHVDTGKTSILDKIRRTSVQQNEAGGITQQIGATFFPREKLVEEVQKCRDHYPLDYNVPGLLIIDTPGHESFSNLRSRGSSLCDIAILVIDLMHGLQNQTLESIRMLTDRGTHFVVALNKIDRSYQWVSKPDSSSFVSLKNQNETTIQDYNNRLNQVKLELNKQGFNIAMYWQNSDINDYVSLVPTSAKTGEGLPDLMSVLVKECMSIPSIEKRLKINNKKFNCTVMEVKMIEGHGTTIDCILVDGVIHKNDQIVLLGFNGPIVTKVKALLTPHPMKQMRVKDQYIHHDFMRAANGIKIDAAGIDEAVAGTPLFVANTEEQVERAIDLCNNQYLAIKNKIKLSDMGVGVAASTLGSLQALLEYLKGQKVPVSNVSVGPVSKEDVMKAMKSLLSQNPQKRKKEYCCVLVFDVKILDDARKYAEENNIKIFWADIIYHLTDHFNKYVKQVREERKQKQGKDAIFPCVLKIVEIFRKSDPVVLGVDVQEGVLKVGTPISVYNKEGLRLKVGVVQSIESNHKKIKEARKVSGSVAVAITGEKVNAGKDFLQTDKLCSLISRRSIDCLKQHFRDDVSKDEWQLVIELKKYLHIQ